MMDLIHGELALQPYHHLLEGSLPPPSKIIPSSSESLPVKMFIHVLGETVVSSYLKSDEEDSQAHPSQWGNVPGD